MWLEAQARRVVAQALGEEPEYTRDRRLPAMYGHRDEHQVAVYTEEVYTEADRDLFDQVWHELQHELGNGTTDDTNV